MRHLLAWGFAFMAFVSVAAPRDTTIVVYVQDTTKVRYPVLMYFKDTSYPADKIDSLREYKYKMYRVDAELYLKCKEFRIKEWEDQYRTLEQNFKRYKSHGNKSDIIFWIVFGIVVVGVAFSAIQFYISFHINRETIRTTTAMTGALQGQPPAAAEESPKIDPSTLKIGKDGIEVTSSILGVIILVISIVFFYLYLIIVYPLETQPSTAKTPAAKGA